MMAARDEARARIAADMGAAWRSAWRARGFGPVRLRCGRLHSGAVVVRQQSGNGWAGRAVPAISLPRLAARQRALEEAAWCRTPRPGEGRAT
jgi:hypothetical protein